MNQLLSTLRLSALLLAMLGTAAYATPGTITPEQDDTVQQDQNGNDDGFIEEDDQDNQGQNQDDGYQDDQGQNQDDNWGDDQGDDQYDRGQGEDQNGKGQKDDGYERPNKPGRDQGKPRHERRPRRLVESVPVRQQFFGGARFPLYMLVNDLQRFQGYRLVNVVINGSSDAGMGMAVFCGSQCGPMQNVGYYINSYPIRTTGERVNRYSNQWFLELRGNFWVDSIQLEFVR